MVSNDPLRIFLAHQALFWSSRHVFKKISYQFFDLDIENLVGRGYCVFAIYEITYFLVPESTEDCSS
jgi:hypothetical protein